MFDPNNYINTLLEECFLILKDHFTSYDVSMKKIESTTITKPTILLLYPRTGIINYEKSYNGQNKYPFYLNAFCLDSNDLGSSKIAGEVQKFVNENQHLFSKEGLKNAKIITAERVPSDGNGFSSTGSQSIYSYMCILKGYCIF